MQPVAPPASRHQAARELVDDDDFAVLDHVVHVQAEERVGAQGLVDVVEQGHVHGIVEAARLHAVGQQLLGLGHAALGQRHGLVFLVDEVVAGRLEPFPILGLGVPPRHGAGRQPRDHAVDLVVEIGGLVGGPRDDERRPGFVDQDAVDLVDHREAVPALDVAGQLELHVVAEVVEAELVVGAVRDVAGVGALPLLVVQFVLDHADREAEEPVDAAHPLRVAPRQVVVHGDHVHAVAGERVQVRGQRRDKRLALAGLHLGDLAVVQHHAADELHVEMAHVQGAPARFPDHREGVHQHVVERGAGGQPLPESRRLRAHVGVAEGAKAGFLRANLRDERRQLLERACVLCSEDFCEEGVQHVRVNGTGGIRRF